MTWVDALVLLWVALSAVIGYQRGLSAQLLSLAGLAIGGLIGARVGPLFLPGGDESPWVPFASLIGAVVGALLLQATASLVGTRLRWAISRSPLRLADSAGGVVIGIGVGLAVAWLAAVAALQIEGAGLRQSVQRSSILSGLVDVVPPRSVLRTLAQLDPLPLIAAPPDLELREPDGSVLRTPVTSKAGQSVVKVESVACGVGVQGSGWVLRQGLVATNAHVVAGEEETRVVALNGQVLPARLVYLDATNDVAYLRVQGLRVPPLDLARKPPSDDQVVLLGYPRDGPLTAVAGTAGTPTNVFAPDAYGRRTRLRTVVPLRGKVQRGDSGGPVINDNGRVVAMIFAASTRGASGFGVPTGRILEGLDSPLQAVDSGPCA